MGATVRRSGSSEGRRELVRWQRIHVVVVVSIWLAVIAMMEARGSLERHVVFLAVVSVVLTVAAVRRWVPR